VWAGRGLARLLPVNERSFLLIRQLLCLNLCLSFQALNLLPESQIRGYTTIQSVTETDGTIRKTL
jgi:hypothetical protein